MSSTTPDPAAGRESLSAQDEAALRAELEEVLEGAVDAMEEREPVGWRVLTAGFLGGLLLFVGLIPVAAFVFPSEGSTRGENQPEVMVGLILLAVGFLLVRPGSRGVVRGYREAIRLRRRAVEIRAQLPPGTAGQGIYRRFINRRFGHPVVAWLFAIPMFMVFVLPVILRRL